MILAGVYLAVRTGGVDAPEGTTGFAGQRQDSRHAILRYPTSQNCTSIFSSVLSTEISGADFRFLFDDCEEIYFWPIIFQGMYVLFVGLIERCGRGVARVVLLVRYSRGGSHVDVLCFEPLRVTRPGEVIPSPLLLQSPSI